MFLFLARTLLSGAVTCALIGYSAIATAQAVPVQSTAAPAEAGTPQAVTQAVPLGESRSSAPSVAPAVGMPPDGTTRPTEPSFVSSGADAVIGIGDLLEIRVLGASDYLQQVRVSNQGQITLPYIGALHVAGLDIAQAESLVSSKLASAGLYNNPQVSISQRENLSEDIAVLGEVQRPGTYRLFGSPTLFDAISAAGGATNKAGSMAVITHRGNANHPEAVKLSYDAQNSPHSNISILPGDTIVISRAGIVYVVGEVNRPTAIVLESPYMTVLQAIAMAEGTKSTAALDSARLIRKGPNGAEQVPFSLKKVLAAKAPDMKLQAEDIIFVPSSTAKSAGKRGLEAIVQAATGLAVYTRY